MTAQPVAALNGSVGIRGVGREVWSALLCHIDGRTLKPKPGTLPFCNSIDEVRDRIAERAAQDPDFFDAYGADTGWYFLPVRPDRSFKLLKAAPK